MLQILHATFTYYLYFILLIFNQRPVVAQRQSVTVKPIAYGFDPHSKRLNIYLNLYFHFFALVSRQSTALSTATQHAMLPDLSGMWGTVYSTGFPLPSLLCAGFSVKLILIPFSLLLAEGTNYLATCSFVQSLAYTFINQIVSTVREA